MKRILVLHKYLLVVSLILFVFGCKEENPRSDETPDFTTSAMTDERDGQSYKIVKIGKQWWMAENLNYYTPSGSWYYNNDSINYSKPYGRLYLWNTIMDGAASSDNNPSKVRGISPKGWHIPSASEWEQLLNYLRGCGLNVDDLKEAGTEHWPEPNAGTNRTLFNAIPTGTVYNDGNSFANLKHSVVFMTSTLTSTCSGYALWGYGVHCDKSEIYKAPCGLGNGWTVRCVKD
jgi:uncharacterized protein (TIGR02145 family)